MAEREQTYSLTMESPVVFIKNMDRSVFLHNEMAIAKRFLPYFHADNLEKHENRRVALVHDRKTFKAHYERTAAQRVRLVWEAPFAHLLRSEFPEWHALYQRTKEDIDTAPKLRLEIADFFGSKLAVSFIGEPAEIITGGRFDEVAARKARQAGRRTDEEISAATAHAPRRPPARNILSKGYELSQEVAEFARRRAAGVCELCGEEAPFKDREGRPYLEVHHLIPLERGGEDTGENTAALCPDCHRRMHVLDRKKDRNVLARKREG